MSSISVVRTNQAISCTAAVGALLAVVALLGLPTVSYGQPACPPAELAPEGGWPENPQERLDALDRGSQSALADKNPEAARSLLVCALELASEADVDRRANLLFRSAVAEQTLSTRGGGDCEAKDSVLDTYRQVHELKPSVPAPLYNMAKFVDSGCGSRQEAEAYYRRAAALEEDVPGFYTLELAKFLGEDRPEEAEALLIKLALTPPHNAEAHSLLRASFLQPPIRRSKDLSRYLWQLFDSGAVVEAQATAVDALEVGLPAKLRGEFLTLIAAGLGRQQRSPADFFDSDLPMRLAAFSDDPKIGDGVDELLAIYRAAAARWTDLQEAAVPWWSEQGDPRVDPKRGIWPRDAMQQLLRGLGSWFERDDQQIVAEACFHLAANLAPDDPDPLAFRDLTELYLRTEGDKAFERIETLIHDYEDPLFEGKGGAYRDGRLADIYEYHRTLGQIYGHLALNGRAEWGDSYSPRTAIFQLERAYQAGLKLDEQARGDGNTGRQHLDLGTTTLLIKGYTASAKPEKAQQIYSSAQSRLIEEQQLSAAEQVRATRLLDQAVLIDQVKRPDLDLNDSKTVIESQGTIDRPGSETDDSSPPHDDRGSYDHLQRDSVLQGTEAETVEEPPANR